MAAFREGTYPCASKYSLYAYGSVINVALLPLVELKFFGFNYNFLLVFFAVFCDIVFLIDINIEFRTYGILAAV